MTRWPPGAERRLVPAKSNLKPHRVGHAAHLHLDSSDGPGPDAWRGHDELVVELCVLHFFSGSVQKVTRDCLCYLRDVLDLCPRYCDEILQVL